MRIVSRKISRHVRRRTIRSGGAAGGSSSAKISGNSAAGIQRSSPMGRSSFVRINRPSFFHSRSASRSTGPYSRPSTRTIHSSGIGQLISEDGGLESAVPWLASTGEAAFDRRALLRLPILFRDPEPLQFPGRTDERHFRVHENAPAHGQTSAAGIGRGVLGRRFAGKTDD